MARPNVFLDSSVLIAAALSFRGGSCYILNTLDHEYEFFINEYVLDEVTRVLKSKFPDKPFLYSRTLALLCKLDLCILDNPSQQELKPWIKIIDETDVPILVSAVKFCDYLLTLDNDFFQPEVLTAVLKCKLHILKPQEFIQGHN